MENKSQMSVSSVKGVSIFVLEFTPITYLRVFFFFFSDPFWKKPQKYIVIMGTSYHKYMSYSENFVNAFLTSNTAQTAGGKLL